MGSNPYYFFQWVQVYVHFIDVFSCYTFVYLLQAKSDTIQIFINFKTHIANQFVVPIKYIQTDWGEEFKPLLIFWGPMV